jgi:hypothetical protein
MHTSDSSQTSGLKQSNGILFTCSLRIVLFTYHSFFLRKDTGHNQGNHKGEELHVRQNLAFEEVEKVYRKDGMPGRNVERNNVGVRRPKVAKHDLGTCR